MATLTTKATKGTEKNNTKKQPAKTEVKEAAEANNAWAEQMAKITAEQEADRKAKAEQKAKELAEKKRPGVIARILEIIQSSKTPITQQQILAKLVEEFPKREEKSMLNTIKAQIGGKKRPLRMEREKQVIFNIVENKAGVKTYSIMLEAAPDLKDAATKDEKNK